jgi:hypothetical protein
VALYPTIKPISVNLLAVNVICPHCGSEEHQRMQHEGREPIQPGDTVLFAAICSMDDAGWGNRFAYYIKFPTRKATP